LYKQETQRSIGAFIYRPAGSGSTCQTAHLE